MEEQVEFFAEEGFIVVPEALSAHEVELINEITDRHLVDSKSLWRGDPAGRKQALNILLACPELDFTMRPPRLLPLMEMIMGPELCADEHSLMIRAANPSGPTECGWHRDGGCEGGEPPYYARFLSVVFYLTDVDDTTHTFSVIPASAQTDRPLPLEDYDMATAQHLVGAAGTAILVNPFSFHAGNVRNTTAERRTIHLYCGRTSDGPLSNHTIFPPRLWRDKDEATRRYYSRPNAITALLAANFL